jgi:hypothetical protein
VKVLAHRPASQGVHPPQYLDLSEYPDFETMQNRVAEAHSLFEDLPAEVRFKFDNKPAEIERATITLISHDSA